MEDKPKRPPGRPKKYEPGKDGAPFLGLRLEPPIYKHIKSKPEGPRAYVTRLVTEDAQRTGEPLGGAQDVPGQMQIADGGNEAGDG